jgi:hypothetical protein
MATNLEIIVNPGPKEAIHRQEVPWALPTCLSQALSFVWFLDFLSFF